MKLERQSHCKVNLLLNVLGRRPDGFHELETVMLPVGVCDTLTFERGPAGINLSCSDPQLPVDGRNLVHRAAAGFFAEAAMAPAVTIHLSKRIPLAAGLGGGSGNSAATLQGLNELFGRPLMPEQLRRIASGLGSDIPFFLQDGPALATGRGERLEPAGRLAALKGCWLLLIHPGFGIATPWAYQQLQRFPERLNGRAGRAARLLESLRTGTIREAAPEFYNALEAPALEKYPLLAIYQEFLRANGAAACLMSGSGSTTFAVAESETLAAELLRGFRAKFGESAWAQTIPAETQSHP